MTCTDCHESNSAADPNGPHGSTAQYMLDPAYSGNWENAQLDWSQPNGTYPNDIICTKCHVFSRLSGPGFNAVHSAQGLLQYPHTRMGGTYCTECHPRIPHGAKLLCLFVWWGCRRIRETKVNALPVAQPHRTILSRIIADRNHHIERCALEFIDRLRSLL